MYFARSYDWQWKKQHIGGRVTQFCYVTVGGGRVLCYGALQRKREGLGNGKVQCYVTGESPLCTDLILCGIGIV